MDAITQTFKAVAMKDTEIEVKFAVEDKPTLDSLLDKCLQRFGFDSKFFEKKNNTGYYLNSNRYGVLKSLPISWYYDTPESTLRENGVQVRVRESHAVKPHYELSIKGMPDSASGIPIRHEEEFTIETPTVDLDLFRSPVSKRYVGDIRRRCNGHGVHLHKIFATDVNRDVFLTEVDGVPIEFAFDSIKYVNKDEKIVATQHEIELEYKGDGHRLVDIRRAMKTVSKFIMEDTHGGVRPETLTKAGRAFQIFAP